ncbi:glycosyltransferase [Atopobiaceae bacterium FL090493]|nr:glycosyltransferase [Atopobiaceae bacterium FL090493]
MLSSASVAMAVYNGELFLPLQIESILKQLHPNDELVISYDESTDSTLSIIEGYASRDSRVRVVRNNAPGIIGNFNNAIAHCANDTIFISDQDDVWLEGKRDRVIDKLNESGADLLIHNVVHIDGRGDVISRPLFELYGIGRGLIRNFARPRYSGCCMAFPRSSVRIVMPMPQTVDCYDHWIGMACEVFGHVVFLNDILLQHRLHGENATVSTRPLRTVVRQRWNLLLELIRKRRVLSQ